MRFFGAGVIGVAAVWTLLKIAGPVVGGIQSAMAAQRVRRAGRVPEQQERDIPTALVVGGAIAPLVPIGWLLHSLVAGGPLAGSAWLLVVGARARADGHTCDLQSPMRISAAVSRLQNET